MSTATPAFSMYGDPVSNWLNPKPQSLQSFFPPIGSSVIRADTKFDIIGTSDTDYRITDSVVPLDDRFKGILEGELVFFREDKSSTNTLATGSFLSLSQLNKYLASLEFNLDTDAGKVSARDAIYEWRCIGLMPANAPTSGTSRFAVLTGNKGRCFDYWPNAKMGDALYVAFKPILPSNKNTVKFELVPFTHPKGLRVPLHKYSAIEEKSNPPKLSYIGKVETIGIPFHVNPRALQDVYRDAKGLSENGNTIDPVVLMGTGDDGDDVQAKSQSMSRQVEILFGAPPHIVH